METAVVIFVDRFRELGLTGEPMCLVEIEALERHLGLPLPAAYKAYLLIAGANPPPSLIGSDCHGKYLYDLHGWAKENLHECGDPFDLPTNAVVFFMHQGYEFYYFEAVNKNEDPAVFFYFENWPVPKRVAERFSEWVEQVA